MDDNRGQLDYIDIKSKSKNIQGYQVILFSQSGYYSDDMYSERNLGIFIIKSVFGIGISLVLMHGRF